MPRHLFLVQLDTDEGEASELADAIDFTLKIIETEDGHLIEPRKVTVLDLPAGWSKKIEGSA